MKEYNLTVELECIPILGLLDKSVLLTRDKKKKKQTKKQKETTKKSTSLFGLIEQSQCASTELNM